VLSRHGNMSSPTVLFILRELMESNADGPSIALAFGPGLSIEATLLT
jgi:predicted naringenin-chalcone synthase